MHPDDRKRLLKLQADLDQQIAEADGLVENANMPVPEWAQANEALRDLGRTRAAIEGEAEGGMKFYWLSAFVQCSAGLLVLIWPGVIESDPLKHRRARQFGYALLVLAAMTLVLGV